MTTKTLTPPVGGMTALEKAVARQGWRLIGAIEVLGDGTQAPGYVTLCQVTLVEGEYVVHFYNAQDRGFHSGSYFDAKQGFQVALEKFNNRAMRATLHHDLENAMKRGAENLGRFINEPFRRGRR